MIKVKTVKRLETGALVSSFHQCGNLEANFAFFLLRAMFYSVCLGLVYRQFTIEPAVMLTNT